MARARGRAEIEVVETATGKVVHEVDVTGKTESQIDRCEMGMLRQMNTDRFFVRVAARATGKRVGA